MDKGKIRDVLSGSPKYEWIRNDVYNISERIRKIDPSYFIVLNRKNGRYEVHSTENIGSTFCFLVPFNRLDNRTLEYCRETRVERDIDSQIDKINNRATKSRDRARRASNYDTAKEMADITKHIVRRETLSSGYTGSHYVRGMK